MITIPLDQNIIYYCRGLLKNNNFGQRGIADGNQSEQLRGIVGQCMVMDLLGLALMETDGFDKGIDFTFNGKTYDVKTMGRTVDPEDYYVNNLIRHQINYKVDRYIFCSLNKIKMNLTICGWIDKDKFAEKANFYPLGMERTRSDGTSFKTKADLYEIPNNLLNQINSINDLITL